MKKTLSVIIILTLLSLCGCKAEEGAENPDTVVIGSMSVIETATAGEYNYDMLSSGVSQMPLVYQNTDGSFGPLVASWKTEDSETWTFTITDGLKWSDGVEVTAEDIIFSLEREDENGSANLSDSVSGDGTVTKAKYDSWSISEDKKTVVLKLSEPNVRALADMAAFRISPKHILSGNNAPTQEELRVSCGPFVLTQFNKDAGTLTYEVNPFYPKTPNVKKIIFRLFGNEDTMYMALLNGDVDLIWNYSSGISASYCDVLKQGGVNIISVPTDSVAAVLVFNNARGPFADENLRQAVKYALDYEQLKTKIGGENASVANGGFVPGVVFGYRETDKLHQDFELAKEYLKKSGYTQDTLGRFANAEGETLSFVLTYRTDKQLLAEAAELIKTQLDSFGIEVKLEGLDSASYNAKTSNLYSDNNVTMEAALFGFTSAGIGMDSGLAVRYTDGDNPVQGGCGIKTAEFKTLLKKLSEAKDPEEYIFAAGDVQDYYAEHANLLALYWDNISYAASGSLENLQVDNLLGLNNVNTWFSVKLRKD